MALGTVWAHFPWYADSLILHQKAKTEDNHHPAHQSRPTHTGVSQQTFFVSVFVGAVTVLKGKTTCPTSPSAPTACNPSLLFIDVERKSDVAYRTVLTLGPLLCHGRATSTFGRRGGGDGRHIGRRDHWVCHPRPTAVALSAGALSSHVGLERSLQTQAEALLAGE